MIRLTRCFALAAAAALAADAASAQTVTFSALPQGSLINFQSTVMAKVFLDKTDLKIVVTPMRGPEAQIAAVNANEAQIMLTDASNAAAALNGQEAFAGRPMTNLRAIAKMVTFN
ncbi:MAG TPA: TAXI family TRAP transporter solute-binding subunit, partial [Alphaproteobacteria bacterium]